MNLPMSLIHSRLRSPRSLTRDELRALWTLRLNQLNLKLTRSKDLAYYRWNTPAPQETKDGRWSFFYDASPKDPQQ